MLLSPGLLDEKSGLQLAPGYPPCLEGDAATFAGYIEENLPAESPILFGLHPNSQISLLQQQAATQPSNPHRNPNLSPNPNPNP